ncbi:PQQ-dependent sugar dehydrogenase [Halococcus salifodinae]|uniref:Quinoprotein glucose dehydrogenase n=1 Tax=Halococcus salifodinae DSM 8989 TaxID=1227456 RepID=M0MX75_9EURY|nr:PQQ-dependent sugar dehydrogenase [Halococcus salifodinae]EMA49005.1 quinoprotein glucose dehydrogenase [Halococcus salifodinae DSM 8989]
MTRTTATAADTAEQDRSEVTRRRLLRTTAAGAVAGVVGYGGATTSATAQDGGPVPAGPTVALESVAGGFEMPTDFATPSGDDRRFVVDRPGQIYVVGADGRREEPFLDVSDLMTPVEGEQGLLGLAFHPDFETNGRFYLRYSAPATDATPDSHSHTAVLAEFRANDDRTAARPGSERRLLEVPEPQSNHNAGALAFGPDGFLYVPFGDGGAANDIGTGHVDDWYDANDGGNGQDVTENFLGSLLRIDVDSRTGDKPYGIPDDNPLVGEEGLDEQFAWGFRNPWRMGFSDGALYVGDVGQNRYEEVDRVVKGGNYGWNVKEGTHCFSTGEETTECPDTTPQNVRGGEPLRDPVIEYPHTRDGETIGISVIGGYVYDGAIDALGGQYVFGDYSQDGSPKGSLFAATPSDEGLWEFTKLEIAGADDGELGGYLLDVGRDDAGELYALTAGGDLGGAVHKLVSPGESRGTAANATGSANGTDAGTNATAETTAGTEANGSGAGGADTATGTDGANGTAAGEEGAENGTSTGSGPGFGAVAVLSGLASVVAYLLAGEE